MRLVVSRERRLWATQGRRDTRKWNSRFSLAVHYRLAIERRSIERERLGPAEKFALHNQPHLVTKAEALIF